MKNPLSFLFFEAVAGLWSAPDYEIKETGFTRVETLVSILVPTAVGTAVTRSAANYMLPPLLPSHTPVASADRYALIKPSISPSITALILAFSKPVRVSLASVYGMKT